MSVITVPRREHTGGAGPAALTTPLAVDGMLITCSDLTGWPTGAVGQFVVTIARGMPSEERILCASRSGDTLAVLTRGWDSTSALDHGTGEAIEHTDSATEFDESNVHITSIEAHGVDGGFADLNGVQTLTNKTMDGHNNTFLNVPMSATPGLTTLVPVGTIFMNAMVGDTAPDGWLWCMGQAILRADYPALFTAIGITYGPGDGTTTFNVPDLRSVFPVGASAGDSDFNFLGKKGGSKATTLTIANMPDHSHTINDGGQHGHNTDPAGRHLHTANANGDHSHATLSVGTAPQTTGQTVVRAGTDTGAPHGSPDTTTNGQHSHPIQEALEHIHSVVPDSGHNHTSNRVGSGTPTPVLPPYISINFMIRAAPPS